MSSKSKADWREKSLGELEKELEKKTKELIEFRFKHRQGQVKNVHQGKEIRKQIAVIKTIISQKKKEEKSLPQKKKGSIKK